MSQITINGILLLPGQTKAVEIAAAKLEGSLTSTLAMGVSSDEGAAKALLKLIREVRELIQCGG